MVGSFASGWCESLHQKIKNPTSLKKISPGVIALDIGRDFSVAPDGLPSSLKE